MAMLASKLLCWWTIQLVLLIQGGQTNSNEDAAYDPWKESDRPKVVVDYHNGPLRGKKQLGPLIGLCP